MFLRADSQRGRYPGSKTGYGLIAAERLRYIAGPRINTFVREFSQAGSPRKAIAVILDRLMQRPASCSMANFDARSINCSLRGSVELHHWQTLVTSGSGAVGINWTEKSWVPAAIVPMAAPSDIRLVMETYPAATVRSSSVHGSNEYSRYPNRIL